MISGHVSHERLNFFVTDGGIETPAASVPRHKVQAPWSKMSDGVWGVRLGGGLGAARGGGGRLRGR